ncbi:hypothetical protein [Sphingomonas palmae]|uniref:hypothetical protein n=1 Tax=Sphingomonas palmae TaxID=1855283 RepID=UPI00115FFAA6|nr:hypothetical protein [Sphingomonas palmae]
MVWTFFPFSTLPAPTSIVWCRFPYVEDVDKPGPKPRPAIVKRASADQDGNPWVHVAYGTTQKLFLTGLTNFTVSNVADMDACGLWCATRFRLDRVALVPWADEFFSDAPGRASPVMGRLSEHQVQLLRYQSALLQRQEQERQQRLPLEPGKD